MLPLQYVPNQMLVCPVGRDGWNAPDVPAFDVTIARDERARDLKSNGHRDMMSGMVVGAGFSKAADVSSPTWHELIENLAKELDVDVVTKDPVTAAFQISRRHDGRKVQEKIVSILTRQGSRTSTNQHLAKAFADCVIRTRCQVIIDLNYDHVVENALKEQNIHYYLVVGSRVDVVAPLPFDHHLVLWKIHGSIAHPSTIVLSPRDYERIYRSNALEKHLRILAAKLTRLVTVGVGLTDDEVWRVLGSGAPEITAIWLSDHWERDVAKKELDDWHNAVNRTRCTILSAPHPDAADPETQLSKRLEQFVAHLRHVQHDPKNAPTVNDAIKDRWKRFDDDYIAARSANEPVAVLSHVISKYNREYNNLSQTVAAWTTTGPGARSLFSLRIEHAEPMSVARDLESILQKMGEITVNNPKRLLVLCCAQEVVRMVLELVHVLGLGSIDFEVGKLADPHVKRESLVTVGLSPFSLPTLDRYNLLHSFTVPESLPIGYPLGGNGKAAVPGAPGGPGSIVPLQTEDQWEARMVTLFKLRRPVVRLGSAKIPLDWAPPIFPWGFHVGGLARFRERHDIGTTTRSWHLVSDTEDLGAFGTKQICKGGSLRDTDIECFKLAYRGYVRMGEFDDLVQPAPA